MNYGIMSGVIFCLSLSYIATAQGAGELVRIPTPISPRCINGKTDEISITLRKVIIHKTGSFITEDKKAGISVIATLNSNSNQVSKTPSVNLVSVESDERGQVRIPLEYPIASLLALSPDFGKTYTKNMLLELYIDKPRGSTTFGEILDSAGGALGKVPLPPNPYLNAASTVLNWASMAIDSASKDKGGEQVASITLQFNNRDETDINKCKDDGYATTGAIALISPNGSDKGGPPLGLNNLEQSYCWRYATNNTYVVEYASKPQGGCVGIADKMFKEIPNDYVMLLVAAAKTIPPTLGIENTSSSVSAEERQVHLEESAKLCDAMKLRRSYCGIKSEGASSQQ